MPSITTLSVPPQPEYTQNRGEVLKCDQCDYESYHKIQLKKHIQKHTNWANLGLTLTYPQYQQSTPNYDKYSRSFIFSSKRFYELFCKHVKTYLEEMITNISPPLSTFCQVTVPLSWGLHTIVFFCLVLKSQFSISVFQYSWKLKKLVCKL